MRLLLFDEDPEWVRQFEHDVAQRNPALTVTLRAETFQHALMLLRDLPREFDALVFGPTVVKGLSTAFLSNQAAQHQKRVVNLTESSTAAAADEVLSAVGLPRSHSADAEVLEELAKRYPYGLETVRWPGVTEPVLRALVDEREVTPASMVAAQRAGFVRGAGLAETVESFWQDPLPHLLQVLPIGLTFKRLRQYLDLSIAQVAALGRGVCDGLVTLHENGFGTGPLDADTVWLSHTGDVLLLGGGLRQTRYQGSATLTTLRDAPPEEVSAELWPAPSGDAFRLAQLMLWLGRVPHPLRSLSLAHFIAADWELQPEQFDTKAARDSAFVTAIITLTQPHEVDRPRGALVAEVLDRAAAPNWKEVNRSTAREALGVAGRRL